MTEWRQFLAPPTRWRGQFAERPPEFRFSFRLSVPLRGESMEDWNE